MLENLKRFARNPFSISAKAAPPPQVSAPTADSAWSETSLYRGADFPKYNPDQLLSRKGLGVYAKMMTDEQVKAVVRFKRDAITSRNFEFCCDHKELSEEEQQFRIEVFEYATDRMSGTLTDALNGILSAMYNGYSLTEKLFQPIEYRGKTWTGIARLKLRPCDTFFFHVDEFGNIEKLTQMMNAKEQTLDVAQFIHYVQNPDWDEHYGRSELRECYRAWFSKDIAIKFQNIHLERFASGFIWVQPKEGKSLIAGSREDTDLRSVLQNIQAKTAIILPGNLDLHIEHPATTDTYERKIAQEDKAIAKALLVPNLLGITEQGNVGSYSQSETQLEAFLWTLDADAKRLEDALNEQLFKELGDYNFGDNLYPYFKFRPISDKKQMEIVKVWTSLVQSNAVQSTDVDEAYLRRSLEMPEKTVIEGAAPDLLLNGAQVTSLVTLLQAVGQGFVSKDSAEAVVAASFPVTEEQARAIVGTTGDTIQPRGGQDTTAGGTGQGTLPGGAVPVKPVPVKPMEETVIGKQAISVSAFSRAMKRVDFAVIANKADNSTQDAVHEIATINSAAVARLVALAQELKLGTADGQPNDVQKIQYTASEMSALKAAATKGLKDAWTIGEAHARREIGKAKGAEFKTDDLALQDLAAAYLKQKGYTLAGDISAATQKIIRNILMEGIKVSKSPEETKKAIYKALESDGMLTEEAVQDALGTTTVKSTSARIDTAIRTTSFEAINEARYSFFSDPALDGFVEALEYSAILDERVTEICAQLDGSVYPIDDEIWQTYRPTNHFNAVASGSLILTRSGYKPIQNVEIGDEVLTHRGNWKRVYSVMAKMPDSSRIKVITLDTGNVIAATDEHPILSESGWKAVGDLNVGDKLFEHRESVSGIPCGSIANPENYPSMFDETSVSYDVGFSSCDAGMSFTVNLKNHLVTDKCEIGYIASDRMLAYKFDATHAKRFCNDSFMPSQCLAPSSSLTDSSTVNNIADEHRIIDGHPVGMLAMNSTGVLSHSESPVSSAARLKSGVSIGNLALLDSTPNGDTMTLAPSTERCFAEAETALYESNRFLVPKVAFGNQGKNSITASKINHNQLSGWIGTAIISIVDVVYNSPVWNIAVEDDESYHVEGIVAHNCRSILIPVTVRDTWTRSEDPTVMPQKGFGFTCSHKDKS